VKRVACGIQLIGLALLVWGTSGAADVTSTAKEFAGEGKNRAAIQVEREVYANRLDARFLMNTLAKDGSGKMKTPTEPRYLYQQLDPIPMHSVKVYTPWLNHFKQSVVFVMGYLDPNRIKIARWSVSLNNETGEEIKSFAGTGHPPRAFFWNARDSKYNPVEVGKGYVPEITLVDYYGAKVNLSQPKLYLDNFIWQTPNVLKAGFVQEKVFQKKRTRFSKRGALVMRELSNLINQHAAVLVDIECSGPDLELVQERAEVMQKYFAKENMRLKKIRIKNVAVSGEAVFYIKAIKVNGHYEKMTTETKVISGSVE
jgi:hypothetical protein